MFRSIIKKLFLSISALVLLWVGALVYEHYDHVPTIRLAVNEWPGFAPAVYAEILGLYKEYDIPIKLVLVQSPTETRELLRNDQVDGLGTVLADMIMLRSAGVAIKTLFMVDYSKEADVILAGPHIRDFKDLKGKTIGIDSLNSFSHLFVLQALQSRGLSEKDVFFKIVPFYNVFEALQKDEVQAAHTWDPEKRKALSNGYRVIASAGDTPGTIIDAVGFREDLLQKYPNVFKKFTRAFFEAQKRMLENPYEATQRMRSFFNNDPAAFVAGFKELHFYSLEENHRKLSRAAEDSFYHEAHGINEFYLKRGQTHESDLFEQVLSEDYLN